jgi:hypothetical protein
MEIYRLLELGREASHQELAEAKRASVGISLQLDHIGRRMDLRLAATDPARAALLEFIDIMDSTYELLTSQQLPADERERKYLGNGGNLVHAMRRFGEAARSYIGAAERGETG